MVLFIINLACIYCQPSSFKTRDDINSKVKTSVKYLHIKFSIWHVLLIGKREIFKIFTFLFNFLFTFFSLFSSINHFYQLPLIFSFTCKFIYNFPPTSQFHRTTSIISPVISLKLVVNNKSTTTSIISNFY